MLIRTFVNAYANADGKFTHVYLQQRNGNAVATVMNVAGVDSNVRNLHLVFVHACMLCSLSPPLLITNVSCGFHVSVLTVLAVSVMG